MADRDVTSIDLKDVELRDGSPEEQEEHRHRQEEEGDVEKVLMNTPGDANGAAAKLDDGASPAARFTGLTKEELLKISTQPFWIRTRLALLVLFWLGWLAMLAGAVAIIVQAPRCKPEPPRDWWQLTAVYDVSTAAFADNNGAGKGDVRGVQGRLDYLKQLNVRAMVMQLIPEDAATTRQEVNFTNVDVRYGRLDELQKLMTEARRKDIKIILDMFPAKWFSNDTGGTTKMREEMKKALKFWMEQGIAGFRIGVEGLGEKEEVNDLFEEWHNVTSAYSTEDKERRVLIADARQDSDLAEYLVQNGNADLPVIYDLRKLSANSTEKDVHKLVESVLTKAANKSIGLAIGGRNGYLATKNPELNRALGVLLLTLPGTPFIYYGDEIGLRDFEGAEIPMPWNDSSGIVNVKSQETHKHNSTLLLYRNLAKLKWSESAAKFGDLNYTLSKGGVFAFRLVWDQSPRLMILFNLGSTQQTLDLVKEHNLPPTASVVGSSTLHRLDDVDLSKLELEPMEALVLKYNYVA
ncbi:amino acid transporter heavy chain SLC3A2 [Lethenteron reissneri]|uniref:amino acid transporter heavy chain SLC3A2 n=1 Tax=Lethenteron reissneri TaxID=7753 RepID=UPI002AB6E1DD|nr:amino acid transporter heavy chain SLC3A2 [Lethenteron reissneri]